MTKKNLPPDMLYRIGMRKKTKESALACSICKLPIENVMGWIGGHNAQPVNDGRCCTVCNDLYVIPARIANIHNLLARVH